MKLYMISTIMKSSKNTQLSNITWKTIFIQMIYFWDSLLSHNKNRKKVIARKQWCLKKGVCPWNFRAFRERYKTPLTKILYSDLLNQQLNQENNFLSNRIHS